MPVPYKPEGVNSVSAYLVIKGASDAIEFYKKAFGAEELFRKPGPEGKLMHARIKIGDTVIMMSDEFPNAGCGSIKSPTSANITTVMLHFYVPDADAAFDRAIKAGAKTIMPVMDTFWGDRYGQLQDPFGHMWSISTQKEILTAAQMEERLKAMMSQMGNK